MATSPTGLESAPPSFDAIMDSVSSMPTATTGQTPPEAPEPVDVAADAPGLNEVEPAEEPVIEPVAAEATPPETTPEPTTQAEVEEGVRPWGQNFHVTKSKLDEF